MADKYLSPEGTQRLIDNFFEEFIYIVSITRHYRLSETLPNNTPLSALSDWNVTEPEYEERYEYVQVPTTESGNDVPSFQTDTYYRYDSALAEYVLIDEVPSGAVWSNIYTNYYTRVPIYENLYYCDVYEWSDGSKSCSDISVSSTYALAKQAIEDVGNANNRIDYESLRINDLNNGLSNVESSVAAINISILDTVDAMQTGNYYAGHITVNDNPPSISLGKQTATSKWSIRITGDGVDLKNGSVIAGQFVNNGEESVLKANNAIVSTTIFRSADGGNGVLGLVAQSNGHLSLKEV